VDRADAVAVAHELPDLYDEPFADSSAIPTTLLSRLTRGHVTVSLSGDGGDELFGGYDRYAKLRRLAPLLSLPAPLRGAIASASQLLPRGSLRNGLAHLRAGDAATLAERLGAHFDDADLAAACGAGAGDPPSLYLETFRSAPSTDPVRRAMFADARVYMTDDILTKVDRASMAHALEVREPLLDHELMGWVSGLPTDLKLRGSEGKYLLKKAMEPYLPNDVLYRKKMGFSVPLATWFRGPLAATIRSVVMGERLASTGLFNQDFLREVLEAHQNGRRDYSVILWTVLMFDAFLGQVLGMDASDRATA